MEPDFFERVYEVVRLIPEGRVTTYGAIAAYLGARSSARMVGYALNAVAGDMSIPCHRVVNRNGELSGKLHFATPTFMREMLESEGISFDEERVLMEPHFWDPADPGKRRPGTRGRKR
jgi:methylated-DNA-protein-cysteine methyltransferase-like protein